MIAGLCKRGASAAALILMAQPGWGLELTERTRACIAGAAMYHSVNSSILEAIVRHESRGRPETVTKNSNGTVDIGMTGINSIHFPELMRKGVAPGQLTDECVSVYVGAWKLSQSMFKFQNSWWAIGAYHSTTPVYNTRYQALIYNELVDMGVMPEPKAKVPPLVRKAQ